MDKALALERISKAREGQHLEFKEASGGLPEDVWETYSAFANTEGGVIVLGVREEPSKTFAVVGVPDAQKAVADFWSILRNPQRVSRDIMLYDGVRVERVDDVDLVVIDVPRAERGDKPVSVFDRRRKGFVAWVRRGDGDFQASPDDLRLMQYDGISSADRKPLEEFTPEALSAETVRRFRNVFSANKPQHPWTEETDEDFLFHIGALGKGRDGALHPTQAGLLAFGSEYEITSYAPHYLLDYREETSGDRRWDDRIVSQSGDWSGNLIDFYYRVSERFVRYFKTPFATDETGTVHGSRNPVTEAVNEALANAIVHAFYGTNGAIRIVLTGDELVISNPGSLLMDRRVAIAGGYSEARNPTLMRMFAFVGVSDRAGSGLQKIWETWLSEFGSEPALAERHGPAAVELRLPLAPKAAYGEESRSNRSADPRAAMVLNDDEIKQLVAGSPQGILPCELHEKTGVSQRTAQERLKALSDAGELERRKDGRFYRYFAVSSR